MKTLISILALTTAIATPVAVAAKPVTITAQMKNYRGSGAYLAIYVADKSGAYKGTLWMAGGKSKYYKHLLGWQRATRGDRGQVRGITGASVGAGRTLKITLDLSDALFDAGYTMHVDAAVEDYRESPSDVVIPLNSANAGKPARGKHFISSFSFE
ncbi:DUF2271 domain-containing protein [Profundibacter sp.]|uniref:DUF2271 domain-containing protein n=1 Tax=Profundibacter sp. TaxID=3101071 RepID=UPI003D1267A7